MNEEIPQPIRSYYQAKNRHDIDAMLVPFSDEAIVVDEGQTHADRAAIRDWMVKMTAKYRVTAEIAEAAYASGVWKVACLVSGNFPGSPATLRYRFTLQGEAITRLEIGA
jgi:hypothetical protein